MRRLWMLRWRRWGGASRARPRGRLRSEAYVGPWLPEPLLAAPAPDLAEHAEVSNSLSMAFLVLLECGSWPSGSWPPARPETWTGCAMYTPRALGCPGACRLCRARSRGRARRRRTAATAMRTWRQRSLRTRSRPRSRSRSHPRGWWMPRCSCPATAGPPMTAMAQVDEEPAAGPVAGLEKLGVEDHRLMHARRPSAAMASPLWHGVSGRDAVTSAASGGSSRPCGRGPAAPPPLRRPGSARAVRSRAAFVPIWQGRSRRPLPSTMSTSRSRSTCATCRSASSARRAPSPAAA
jgi:hypothetical protein